MSSFHNFNEIENSYQQKINQLKSKLSSKKSNAFLMRIADVFTIEGRGIVVTGRIERGSVKVDDTVEIISKSNEPRKAVINGIESFNKTLDEAHAGDNIGCLLRGIKRDDIERGDLLATPGSITPQND